MKTLKCLLLISCVLVVCCTTSQAQTEDLDYSSGSQGEDGALSFKTPLQIPYAGYYSSIAGDTDRNEVVLFGGYDSSWNLSSATWVWTKENGWEEKFPATTPPARSQALMCYDSDRKEIILYGGWSQNGQLNDTWVWNGEDWQQKTQENPLSINYWGSAMVYDAARKRAVIISSGGYWYSSSLNMYSMNGSSWTQETITLPSSNYYYYLSAAYDAKNEKIVLLTYTGDTLLYDGTSWVNSGTTIKPFNNSHWDIRNKLAWDPILQKVIFFGGRENDNSSFGNDTWVWDGSQWEEISPDRSPSSRYYHAITGIKDGVILVGGYVENSWDYSLNGVALNGSTELWDGENWNYSSGGVFDIDMNEKENGVWRYSSITIPKGTVVRFNRNEMNSPVQWLASGHVEIDGIVDVSGQNGEQFYAYSYYYNNTAPSNPLGIISKGGPGGFDGGRGGIRFQTSGNYSGMPGNGPGGGDPGELNNNTDSHGKPGGFTGSADSSGAIISTYGNTYLHPLVGGSGGGGSASFDPVDGVSGGGGGGAILIASTRDITINGQIRAKGGNSGHVYYYNYNNYYNYNYYDYYRYSGAGSGGAIRLVADRVQGKGNLIAGGGYNYYSDEDSDEDGSTGQTIATTGRIRIEAYERELANSPSNFPAAFQAPPIQTSPIKDLGKLRVASVGGENVQEPPTGDLETPDVVFDAAGTVKIMVAGENVADGTRIRVRITMQGKALVSEPATLTNGQAEFNINVPAGVGTIQAYSIRSFSYTDEDGDEAQPQS